MELPLNLGEELPSSGALEKGVDALAPGPRLGRRAAGEPFPRSKSLLLGVSVFPAVLGQSAWVLAGTSRRAWLPAGSGKLRQVPAAGLWAAHQKRAALCLPTVLGTSWELTCVRKGRSLSDGPDFRRSQAFLSTNKMPVFRLKSPWL